MILLTEAVTYAETFKDEEHIKEAQAIAKVYLDNHLLSLSMYTNIKEYLQSLQGDK